MVGKFVVLDEVPCEKVDTGETEYYTGVFKVIEWDELNYGFFLESKDDLQEQYWAPAEYVTPSEISEPEVDTLDEQYGMPAVEHPLGEHTGNMTENQIDQGFRASMERIYRSLLEVGYSADEAQAQVKKLIAEIEQERQALEQPPVEEDVSLDRQTMPSEHLGWYQSDFHEKGNEDLELPNVKEDIVMPDEPTGLEKD